MLINIPRNEILRPVVTSGLVPAASPGIKSLRVKMTKR